MHLTVVAQRQDRLDFPGKPGTRGIRESIICLRYLFLFLPPTLRCSVSSICGTETTSNQIQIFVASET
jgi:hypothetical protein